MKKVIDGKVYNTETATCIATWNNNLYGNDFRVCEETLYITQLGAYFVQGEGGALSRWSRPCGGNGKCGGDGLELLSKKEALAWCEQHEVDADEIAEYFELEEG